MGQGSFWGGQVGPNPTDRGKAGTKRSLLVEGQGGSVVIAGANVHDTKLRRRPLTPSWWNDQRPPKRGLRACAWTTTTGRQGAAAHHSPYSPHRRGEAGRVGSETLSWRRWVVERTLAWLSKCRALLVRYDKKPQNFLGLLQLACALVWYRRLHRLSVLG